MALFMSVALGLLIAVLCAMLAFGLTHPPRVTAGAAAARGWWIDPVDAGFRYDEWTLDRPDGARLPVWDIHNPDCESGPTVIMSHSWGGSRITSLQRLPFVIEGVARVIIWDMRGHGEALARRSGLGTPETDDLLDLIDRVTSESAPVLLYGSSFGGFVSIGAAARDERVIGVIADGAYRRTGEPIRGFLRFHRLPSWPIHGIVHRYLFRRLRGLGGPDRARVAAQLKAPLLVLHSRADPISPGDSARAIADAASDGHYVEFADATHLDLHDRDPDRYRDEIARFIDRCFARAMTRSGESSAAATARRAMSP
ncbi:MAG: alpha/beta hydrolase [Phycisphaerales bacterium]